MEEYTVIKRICMDCPVCDKHHEVEERKRIATDIIKGMEVSYEERYYFCKNSNSEFMPGAVANENLQNARKAYQKRHSANYASLPESWVSSSANVY